APAAALATAKGARGHRRSTRQAADHARVDARPRRTCRALPPASTAAASPTRAHPRCLRIDVGLLAQIVAFFVIGAPGRVASGGVLLWNPPDSDHQGVGPAATRR